MKLVVIAIRDFALPCPRVGSIEIHSGYGRSTLDGQEIHLRVQGTREKDHDDYEAEVKMTGEFDRDDYRFRVTGRADGVFKNGPKIEEIKSCFELRELKKKLTAPEDHPYCLQLKTYGYLYWRTHQIEPKLSFHLVSTRSWKTEDLELEFEIEAYEQWLERRLGELVVETRHSEALAKRRQRTAKKLQFPFSNPRPGQIELISHLDNGMKNEEPILIQAPTGLGKTVGVMYPVLKEALSRGQRVVYVTPKNSQHAVAEDAVERFQDHKAKIKSLTITAKSKICFKAEPLCNPDYCEYARDHYTKVDSAGLVELLAKKKKLSTRVFSAIGEQYQVCPFELQLDAVPEADVVICDYNYVFAPRSALGMVAASKVGQAGKPNLVVDEAHNLLERAIGYYSPELSTVTLEKMRGAMAELPPRFQKEGERLLLDCQNVILECRPEGSQKTSLIDPPLDLFVQQEMLLRSFLSRYLEFDIEIKPRDVVLRLSHYWAEFTAILDFITEPKHEEFFVTFRPQFPSGGAIKVTCCDASKMLKACYDEYEHIVGFSATLKPFDYYAKLSGLDPKTVVSSEFHSPFPKQHRKLLIIPEISTKYSQRERNYRKISEAIRRIAAVKKGNYFAFFPSFHFLEKLAEVFVPPEGFTLLRQQRDMKAAEIERVIQHLKERTEPTIVFAVSGGVFSEGVDYPGETVIGAFVIGPPLPMFDLEREKMRTYYDEKYGFGFDYAYAYPAMAKAVQAAGRVVRSETDRGIIVLMDDRFLHTSYSASMPTDWFERHPGELVSKQILKEVTDFWEQASHTAPTAGTE